MEKILMNIAIIQVLAFPNILKCIDFSEELLGDKLGTGALYFGLGNFTTCLNESRMSSNNLAPRPIPTPELINSLNSVIFDYYYYYYEIGRICN